LHYKVHHPNQSYCFFLSPDTQSSLHYLINVFEQYIFVWLIILVKKSVLDRIYISHGHVKKRDCPTIWIILEKVSFTWNPAKNWRFMIAFPWIFELFIFPWNSTVYNCPCCV
jgi:hypothetical protein